MKNVLFTSDLFRPYLPDECQVNPNVLGFELTEWLSRALAGQGIVTSYPNHEDWGWYLDYSDDQDEYLVHCSGSLTEHATFEWRVFIDRPRRMFRRPPPTAMQDELLLSVVDALHTEGIVAVFEEA